jgi:hypothetical protein
MNYVCCYAGCAFVLIVLHVKDFMMANCGCSDVAFELVWQGIRYNLNGCLKTAGPLAFLGTVIAIARL